MKYVRDDALKAAFIRMINKLVFGHSVVLKPFVESLKEGSKDAALHRIQKLQTQLLENSGKRETLAKLVAQGYIDQIIYNEENNELLRQAGQIRTEIEPLGKTINGKSENMMAAMELLHWTGKGIMLEAFDEDLFKNTVARIVVASREEIAFEMKCGLTLKERM